MKIISIILKEDENTEIITDNGKKIILKLKQYFRIPQGILKIDFENEEALKEFCIENQVLNY